MTQCMNNMHSNILRIRLGDRYETNSRCQLLRLKNITMVIIRMSEETDFLCFKINYFKVAWLQVASKAVLLVEKHIYVYTFLIGFIFTYPIIHHTNCEDFGWKLP